MVLLWIFSGVLLSLKFLVDWDSIEIRRVESRVASLLDIQKEVLDLLVTGHKEDAELDLTNSNYQYRVFTNGELTDWSDNRSLPSYSQLKQSDSIYFLQHEVGNQGLGKFIVRSKSYQKEGNIIEFFSLLPIENSYQIQNRYLRDIFNPQVFRRQPRMVGEGSHAVFYGDVEMFRMEPSGKAREFIVSISAWVGIASLPFLVAFFLNWAFASFSGRKYVTIVFTGLVLFLGILISIGFPRNWLNYDIFSQEVFSTAYLGLTIGELIFAYSIFLVVASIATNHIPADLKLNNWFTRLIIVLSTIFLVYGNMWGFHWLIMELMVHSQIEFDITASIQFTFSRLAAFALILMAASLYFLMNHLFARVISGLRVGGGLFLLLHLVSLFVFIQAFPDDFPIFILQFSWYWIMYLADLSLEFKSVRQVALEYVLSIGAMLALVFAYANYDYFQAKEEVSKRMFANKLALEKDVLGEYYLDEIMGEIRNDETIIHRLNGGIFSRQNIRERLRRQFVSSYFDKYELEILLFDTNGNLFDSEGNNHAYYRETFATREFATDYNGIFLVNDSDNISQRKYACFIDVQGEGHVIINLNRKRNAPTNVFPELLVESKYEQENIGIYDFTIFRDSAVLYGQGTFGHVNYLDPNDLKNEKLYEQGITESGRHFLGTRTEDGRTIVIVSPSYPNRNWVINFSFLFLLFILLISLVGIVYRLILNYKTLTLANKIQLYLALGFLIPLFITGFTLLNTLNDSYREEITRSYLKKSLRISENVVDETIMYVNNESDLNSFANYIGSVSGFVQADLNIYDTNGKLITTSQPGIFGLNLLSDRINPIALAALNDDSQNIILDESIGLLDFKTTYTSITGYTDGQIYGIIALPFFDSKNHLRRQQKEVFADLLMIFALIFLFALISGNNILNYLIGPLKIVSDHLKKTNWEEENQQLDYDRDDEIGVLVKEYNQMLVKLERNKEALVRSQKESAWKEIARQVAHEIKNPLTPMRLKIQQLQRDSNDGREVGVLESLIKQIDTMSHIADSFSEFAKMPAPENEDFDLVSVINESVLLHIGKGVSIDTDFPDHAIMVWADPKIIDRIMNNLLLNAQQAVKDKMPELDVRVWTEDNKVFVSCKDNGVGIPDDIKDKIFTTYFSTKSTGSGIGLAVAKKGIENAGGNIWFESKVGEGTTFYISLPVYEAY